MREIALPSPARTVTSLSRVDNADAFLLLTDRAGQRSAEGWARAMLEGASATTRRTLRRGWFALGVRLGSAEDPARVLGWAVHRSSPDIAVLGARSVFGMQAEVLFERKPEALLVATMMRFSNPLTRAFWAGFSASTGVSCAGCSRKRRCDDPLRHRGAFGAAIIAGMTSIAPALAQHYHQRLGQLVSADRVGGWRLKLYGLAAPDKGVRPELVAATRRLAEESLPPVDDQRHGVAFAIAHDARFPIALIYWWQGLNEIHHRIFAAPEGGDPTDLREITGRPMGCVWELGLVEFERRAWIEDVIGNPDGPDLDRYMSRHFRGLI